MTKELKDELTNLISKFDEKLKQMEEYSRQPDLIKQSELRRFYKISPTYVEKLERAGLRRWQAEEGDRVVWYSHSQFRELWEQEAD